MAQFQFSLFDHKVNVYGQRKWFSCCFPFLRHLMAHRAKEKKSETRCTIGPRPMFLSRHLVAQGKISRHIPLSVLDRFFFFYATPWHRAEVLDALLNRSSTDCFLIPPRGTEQQSSTHCSNGPRHQVARQTKPNTTVRLKWTLIETSRPTPLSRDKHEKVQTTQIISSVLNQNQKQLPNIWQPPIHKDKERKKTKRVQQQKT